MAHKNKNYSRIKSVTTLANNAGLELETIHISFSSNEASKKTYSFSDLTNIDDKSKRGVFFYENSVPKIAVISGKQLNKLIAKGTKRKVKNGLITIVKLTDILEHAKVI